MGFLVIAVLAALSAYLTAPRTGGRMDAESTSADGAHALVTILRDHGVHVTVAQTVADVERAAGPHTLLLAAQTHYTRGNELLRRLASVPGDRLLVEPTARVRDVLAPGIRITGADSLTAEPNCDLHAADRVGTADLGASDAYAPTGSTALTRCYGGALVQYQNDGRTITVVGSADFMTNGALLKQGNAALAMNLAGAQPNLIWYAPQRAEGEASAGSSIGELIPHSVKWIVWQLCVAVVLIAIWQGRRLGPLVAERLPVVVRASETVEGRARLYRSRRARPQAAQSLRAATLHRLIPRLGLGANASDAVVVATIAQRSMRDGSHVHQVLFGPAPTSDDELLQLAHDLDDIERQVTQQ